MLEWISVGERLPPSNYSVLAWDGTHWGRAEYWSNTNQWVRFSDYGTIKGVTHWAEVKGPGEV